MIAEKGNYKQSFQNIGSFNILGAETVSYGQKSSQRPSETFKDHYF